MCFPLGTVGGASTPHTKTGVVAFRGGGSFWGELAT